MVAAEVAQPVPDTILSKPVLSASPWVILIVLALGEFMILLDTTIVNVAIPSVISSLHASGDQILWVLNAYILSFAILLITSGRLGGMVGPKRLFVGGLLIFTLASAGCGLSQTSEQLIAARVIQAIGGAMLVPQTLSILTSVFPKEKQAAAFGIWGAVYGLGAVSGPTLGGLLTTSFSWRAIFFPNVPIGLAACILALLVMPDLRTRTRHRLDVVGILLATAGLFALIFSLVEGQRYGWGRITTPAAFDLGPIHGSLISIPTTLLASVAFLALFILWESRQREPLLPLGLLRDRNFSVGCAVSAIQVFTMAGLFLPMSLFLQAALGLSALQAGAAMVPAALASMVTAPLSGRLASRWINGKYLLIAGLGLNATGMFLLTRVASVNAKGTTFTLPLILIGLGVGMTFAPLVSTTMRNILPTASGAASGFMNTIRQVGDALGASVVGAVLLSTLSSEQLRLAISYASRSNLSPKARATFIAGFSQHSGDLLSIGSGQARAGSLGRVVFQHAFLNAVRPALVVPLSLGLLGALLTLFLKPPRPGRATHGQAVAEAVAEPGPAAPARGRLTAALQVPAYAAVGFSSSLVVPSDVRRGTVTVALHPTSYLMVARNGDQIKHVLRGSLSIGRSPDNNIALDDPEASRRHAVVALWDGKPTVRDLNSANGTLLNGKRLEPGVHPLHDADILTIGKTFLAFHNDLERGHPRLEQLDGPGRVEFPIEGVLTIGRRRSSDISVQDPDVSRLHAEITTEWGRPVLQDLGSLNGTWVNGRLLLDDHILQDGDVIRVGGATFIFRTDTV